ncbi:ShKT domain-containing protein [Caenorhabditis elegans]|uniref:ShKT domain-containing protein n=1 Tax=Caenorhabditis elegans TaxID=6239 RepID=Q9XV59_CAEEL|nr:ShKT domain-containing protein [Caenorhabditis elegans]CAB04183.1 ShKT domain-containing protein [Caenorhabditis elegans]|eukprot:NP_507155.1 Uncharacterized protein CELE_F26D2.13 [Caenorhabditis elegans]
MHFLTFFVVSVIFTSGSQAAIGLQLNCTTYDSTLGDFIYTPSATACDNVISDVSCRRWYGTTIVIAGTSDARPASCFSDGTARPNDQGMVRAAVELCPKLCGFCCMTTAYNCRNADFPRLNCATIVPAQCRDQRWRTIIAQDCPSACGFCNLGGCVDAVTDCANDPSICNMVGMQNFVNQNCQRTCSRCPSSTSTLISSTAISSSCTSYIPDSSSSCASWAANGFCTNNFYTIAGRRAVCATTCRIC